MTLQCSHAQTVLYSSSSYKIDGIAHVRNILNPGEHQTLITDSKVMPILLNGWMLPVVKVVSVKGMCAVCIAHLFFKHVLK